MPTTLQSQQMQRYTTWPGCNSHATAGQGCHQGLGLNTKTKTGPRTTEGPSRHFKNDLG